MRRLGLAVAAATLAIALATPSAPQAQTKSATPPTAVPPTTDAEALRAQGYLIRATLPIFSQLVSFALPKTFGPASETARGDNFVLELVPKGETPKEWTQMITVTGAKGLASNAQVTPENLFLRIASGYRATCPDSFAVASLGATKFSGHDAFAGILGCGISKGTTKPQSEVTQLIVIRGKADYYTLQWAERGKVSKTPPTFDKKLWGTRLKALDPIKVCALVPGEQAPYPSCLAQKAE